MRVDSDDLLSEGKILLVWRTVTVDIKRIHSVDIVSIDTEIYILYVLNKISV